jgi:hypothetical protein
MRSRLGNMLHAVSTIATADGIRAADQSAWHSPARPPKAKRRQQQSVSQDRIHRTMQTVEGVA